MYKRQLLYGMIGMVGIRIWVENKVNFDKPVNVMVAAITMIIAVGQDVYKRQFFDHLDSLITLHQRKYCGVASWMLGVALVRLGSESDGAFGEMKHVLR